MNCAPTQYAVVRGRGAIHRAPQHDTRGRNELRPYSVTHGGAFIAPNVYFMLPLSGSSVCSFLRFASSDRA